MSSDFTRRRFIKNATTFIASQLILAHGFGMPSDTEKIISNKARIKELHLDTNTELEELKSFYVDRLGMELVFMNKYQCCFRAGSSNLQFTKINAKVNAPFYHFAFNISQNKIQHAEEWLKQRTELIQAPKHLIEKKIDSSNIVSFKHWNAHALFFYDPAGNVLEFIARHDLANSGIGKFTNKDIKSISEIGFVVDEIEAVSNQLSQQLGLNNYGPSTDQFSALGDEDGLLLLFRKGSKSVFGKGRDRMIYNTGVILDGRLTDMECLISSYPYYICSS